MHKIISNKFKCIVFNVDFGNDFLLPVGIFSFVKSKSREGIDSVKNKLWPLGDDVHFIPGHGPVSTFKAERSSNPFVSDSVLG